jgi:hypothetical protein
MLATEELTGALRLPLFGALGEFAFSCWRVDLGEIRFFFISTVVNVATNTTY